MSNKAWNWLTDWLKGKPKPWHLRVQGTGGAGVILDLTETNGTQVINVKVLNEGYAIPALTVTLNLNGGATWKAPR